MNSAFEMSQITIRSFKAEDREDVRRISCETAFLGLPLSLFIDDESIVADALTRYYTDFEPGSCFVAILNNKVVGYLTGALNVRTMSKIFAQKITGPILVRAFIKGVFFRKNTIVFLWNVFKSIFRQEFASPDYSRQYPATLHINIEKNLHRHHIGSQLISRYLTYLEENAVGGVHFGTLSFGAKEFFLKNGFLLLYQGHRSYLRYITHSVADYYIFGKILRTQE